MYHILLMVDFFPPHRGGVETVFDNIVQRLTDHNHRVTVITSRYDRWLPAKEINNDLTIYRVGKSRLEFMRYSYLKAKELLMSDPSIDIIHSSTYAAAIPSSLVARRYRKKVLLTVHEIFAKLRYRYKWWWWGYRYQLFERLLFCFQYDLYHCVSYYTLNSVRIHYGLPDDKLELIHNGVNEDRNPSQIHTARLWERKEKLWSDWRYTVLYYGHAGVSKWIDYLVEAMPELMRKIPNIHLVCNIIDARRKKVILKKIAMYQAIDHITVLDGLDFDDLRHLVASVDVVVVPSLSEWFGSVISEVSQLWQKLITTNVSAIPEAAFGQVMFIKASSSKAIVDAVIMAQKGKWFESIPDKQYHRDTTVDKITALYEKLLSNQTT